MTQLTKTVYFSDYPRAATGRSGLTIPFPEASERDFAQVAHLSSFTIREIIGYDSFAELESDARKNSAPTAAFARALLLNQTPAKRSKDYAFALQATFKGGRGSPLHDWYPYLEGYSPDFVNSVIDSFCPEASSILDPFCGSGTTALTGAVRGIATFYAEVNPVCRFITEAKLRAANLAAAERDAIAQRLESIAGRLDKILRSAKPCSRLRAAFAAAFGESAFFGDAAFQDVLRLRTVLDAYEAADPDIAAFLQVAALRSLIPCSLLIRRGDLRYKTEHELRRGTPKIADEMRASLRLIASDLHDAPRASAPATLVCPDAREVGRHLGRRVDAIITSPPYLNGTNYFRNTKVELWFMRLLDGRAGLRTLRDAAITSGINDVTGSKSRGSVGEAGSGRLRKVLSAFSGNAYDVRIPMMVRSYFGEMGRVFDAFADVVAPNGTVAIDLGDSCYGSVWVPADLIVADLMKARGFSLVDKVVLRERQSRDGRKLNQSLQVFRRKSARARPARAASASASQVPKRWTDFKQNLWHQKGDMAKRNWGHPLHSLCSYQGKLKPALAHSLVASLVGGRAKRILDPFVGVGTIPFEARLQGHIGYGFDISPAALAISRAKVEPVDAVAAAAVLRNVRRAVDAATDRDVDLASLNQIRFNGPIPSYFHPRTLAEIVAARAYFRKHPPADGAGALVFSAMLHILHGNRPYALSRRSHPITPFAPTGPAEYRSLYDRLADKVGRSLAALEGADRLPRMGRIFDQDATAPWPKEVDELDAVITSPPFFDSTRFHTANWMRLWFAGWEAKDFQVRPASFVDERQKISFDIYRPIFQQCARRLKPGGLVLIHVGKSAKCNMAQALIDIAAEHLSLVDVCDESVAHCESHGIRDKGTVTHHQYVLLRKPG